VARLSIGGALEQLGLRSATAVAREARWAADLVSVVRPDRAVRLTAAWLREPLGRRAYRVLSEEEMLANRRSDTVFVFGSGATILDIGPEAWEEIAAHDTVAFSHFHRQRSIRVDYHLIAEILDLEETAVSIRANPCYRETIFVVLKGWLAQRGNEIVGRRLLPHGARIFRCRRVARGQVRPPSRSFAGGLVHGPNSSLDVTNFAYLMGWKRIVVVGVDLYDKQYFWLPRGVTGPGEPPGTTAHSRFPGADETVEMFGLWRERMAADGVELEVYDSRSLLSEVLPVFSRSVV
jgi:hypothetical protein